MLHMVNLTTRAMNSTFDTGIPSGTTREIFEDWARFIFIALKTIIEASVRFVVRFTAAHDLIHFKKQFDLVL